MTLTPQSSPPAQPAGTNSSSQRTPARRSFWARAASYGCLGFVALGAIWIALTGGIVGYMLGSSHWGLLGGILGAVIGPIVALAVAVIAGNGERLDD